MRTPPTLWSQDISFQVHTQLAIVGVVSFPDPPPSSVEGGSGDETIFGAVEKYYHSKINFLHGYLVFNIQLLTPNFAADIVGIAQGSKQKIEAKFAVLLTNVCKKLREKPIDFTELQMFFTSFFSQGKCIAKSSNIHETFDMLTRHKLWDYWNYYPLERLVQAFAADDQEIQSWIEAYKQDLRSYKLTTKLIDHIAAVDFDSSYGSPSEEEQLERPARYDRRYYSKLSLKLKMRFSDYTLHYIEDLWEEFAELYDLPPHVALLESISKGCVLIVWLVPTHLAPQILHTPPHSDDFYHKHEIMKVEFRGKCIYQEKELDEVHTSII